MEVRYITIYIGASPGCSTMVNKWGTCLALGPAWAARDVAFWVEARAAQHRGDDDGRRSHQRRAAEPGRRTRGPGKGPRSQHSWRDNRRYERAAEGEGRGAEGQSSAQDRREAGGRGQLITAVISYQSIVIRGLWTDSCPNGAEL